MNPLPPEAVMIVNPRAGGRWRRRPAAIARARQELLAAGTATCVWETSRPGDGEALARRARQAGAELVIVCGGDGTINEAVCGLAQSRVPLAILPGGTANVLARELGLPLNLPAAARRLVQSVPRRLSLGRAGSRHFLLMAGVGFDAAVVRGVNGSAKQWLGMGSYVMEAFRQLAWRQLPRFTLSTPAARFDFTFACIAKAQHYGPIRLAREADLFSDQFCVYGFHSTCRLRYLLYAGAVVAGASARLSDVRRFTATAVRCEPANPAQAEVFLQVDGELAGRLPCTIEIVPDALTLLVPEAAGGGAASSRIWRSITGISKTARLRSAAALA